MTAAPAAGLSIIIVAALIIYRIWKIRSGRNARKRQRLVACAREFLGILDDLNGRNNHVRAQRYAQNRWLDNPVQNEDHIAQSDLRSLQIRNLQNDVLKLMNKVQAGRARGLDEVRDALEQFGALALKLAFELDQSDLSTYRPDRVEELCLHVKLYPRGQADDPDGGVLRRSQSRSYRPSSSSRAAHRQ